MAYQDHPVLTGLYPLFAIHMRVVSMAYSVMHAHIQTQGLCMEFVFHYNGSERFLCR